jgi:hypothetical protein
MINFRRMMKMLTKSLQHKRLTRPSREDQKLLGLLTWVIIYLRLKKKWSVTAPATESIPKTKSEVTLSMVMPTTPSEKQSLVETQ